MNMPIKQTHKPFDPVSFLQMWGDTFSKDSEWVELVVNCMEGKEQISGVHQLSAVFWSICWGIL